MLGVRALAPYLKQDKQGGRRFMAALVTEEEKEVGRRLKTGGGRERWLRLRSCTFDDRKKLETYQCSIGWNTLSGVGCGDREP